MENIVTVQSSQQRDILKGIQGFLVAAIEFRHYLVNRHQLCFGQIHVPIVSLHILFGIGYVQMRFVIQAR